ncbi:MAG TPA: D-2-hydroxyacid dehydrogenase [Methylomirabilota bacterium]|nr:D-2-hydroxyacid dehydrogenase [Methylomirabilota bacterium]
MTARPSVLLWLDQPDAYLRAAQTVGLARAVDLVTAKLSADPPDEALARADALLAWRPPARLRERAPRLRWIQSLTGGVEQWLAIELPTGIVLTCARGTHRLQMPENILGALFLVAKQLGPIVLDQRERRWRRRINPTLAGTTLGILGVGAIGAELARKAAALEMRVIGTKRDGAPVPHVERVFRPEQTDEVLAQADYLVLLLPSIDETRGIMNARAFGRMKPTAHLLNFGRGDLVVDDDLVQAVRERRIAGAVLDVFTTEPLPAEHPFWTTEGIVVLPHVGGLHPQRDDLVAELWVDNLAAFLAGRPLRAVVDAARGY